jgi:hypothetical protein
MAWYRMYFIDRLGLFRVPHDLNADNDKDALSMAHALQYACSDIHAGIELWQGARRIPGASSRTPMALRASWDEVLARKQETLLRIEEALHNGGTAIARSRKLEERIEATRLAIQNGNDAALRTPSAAPLPKIPA